MRSVTLLGKIAFLLLSAGIYYYFEKSYYYFSGIFAVLCLCVFLTVRILNKNHIIVTSRLLLFFPLLFMILGFRSSLAPDVKVIPEEFFIRKKDKQLIRFSGSVQIVKMISPGLYIADFSPVMKSKGYFPKTEYAEKKYYNNKYNKKYRKGKKYEVKYDQSKDYKNKHFRENKYKAKRDKNKDYKSKYFKSNSSDAKFYEKRNVYNRKRKHSKLDYLSPFQYFKQLAA